MFSDVKNKIQMWKYLCCGYLMMGVCVVSVADMQDAWEEKGKYAQ